MARNLDARTFDSTKSTNTSEREILFLIYNNPVKLDTGFNILPDLAETWEFSSDGKAITFHFAKGVKFHDGASFNAEAFKWQMELHLNKDVASLQRSILEPAINSVQVVDQDTAVLRMKQPFRPILASLADRPGYLMSPTSYQKLGDKYGAKPSGTGPFAFSEWVPDNQVTIKKSGSYWEKGKPYLDTILFQNVPDASVQVAMLRTGETDVLKNIPAQQVKILETSPGVKIAKLDGAAWHGLQFSVDREPWNNKALRQAVAYAMDRDTLLKTYYGGAAKVAYQLVGLGWSYNPDIKMYEFDLKKAKEKMVEAGYPNGISVTMWCSSAPSDLQLCESHQAMLKQIGVNIAIEPVLPANWYTLTLQRKQHFTPSNWIPRGDPDGLLRILVYSKGGQNSTGYNNPEVDKLLDDAAQIYDAAKAKALYEKIYTTVAQDAPYVSTVYPTYFTALNSKTKNFQYIPDGVLRLGELWLER